MGELPFIDRHEVDVDAPPRAAWDATLRVISANFGGSASERFARIVGCENLSAHGEPGNVGSAVVGFTIAEAEPPRRLRLEGRHRFSRYALTVEIAPRSPGSVVAAITEAEFPGLHGQAYKTVVIRSRIHVLVTRRLLGAVKRRAELGLAEPSHHTAA